MNDDDLMKDFLLEAFPNPERKGCPDEATLKTIAEDPMRIDEPTRTHIGSCSECYAEYRNYRLDWQENSPPVFVRHPHNSNTTLPTKPNRFAVVYAIAASVVLSVALAGVGVWNHFRTPGVQVASAVPVNASVDLFNSGTSRSAGPEEASTIQEVSLPPAVIHLAVVLPRFSPAGRYDVIVSKDKVGQSVVAMGAGTAVEHGDRVDVEVTLDLRSAARGAYFLGTVRGTDNGAYYYPLRVQ